MFGFVPSCLNHSTTPRNIGSANTRFCSPVTLFLRGVAGAVAGCSTIALHEMSRQSQLTLSDHESRIPGAPLCTLVRACEYPSLVQLLASKRDSIRPLRAVKRHALALPGDTVHRLCGEESPSLPLTVMRRLLVACNCLEMHEGFCLRRHWGKLLDSVQTDASRPCSHDQRTDV